MGLPVFAISRNCKSHTMDIQLLLHFEIRNVSFVIFNLPVASTARF